MSYILVHLRTRILGETGSITHHLGYLPTCYIVARAEGTVRVAGDYATADETPDVAVEGAARRYVCEGDGARCRGSCHYC